MNKSNLRKFDALIAQGVLTCCMLAVGGGVLLFTKSGANITAAILTAVCALGAIICGTVLYKFTVEDRRRLAVLQQDTETQSASLANTLKALRQLEIDELKQRQESRDKDLLLDEASEKIVELSNQLAEQEQISIESADQAIQAIEHLKLETERQKAAIEEMSQAVHEVNLTCAYCNAEQPVVFNIAAGEFKCKRCEHINAVHTNIYTSRTNTILS